MAQPSKFLFHHQGNLNENGINFVNDILFDSQKRVWLGGQTGFYRYDGQHYIAYLKTKDSSSIPDNFVHALCEDKQGNIWGGTEAGIFRFNPQKQTFERYVMPDSNTAQSFLNICCDINGNVWATTVWHLLRFNAAANVFEIQTTLHPVEDSMRTNIIKKRGLLSAPNGRHLWMATRQGIGCYNIETKTWQNSANQPNNPLFAKVNTGALSLASGGLFMYFDNINKHIVKFDPNTMSVAKRIPIGSIMPDAVGATLFEASDGKIWFSSWSNEVLIADQQQNDRLTIINSAFNEPLGLLSNFFWQARQDEDGSIWLATPEGIFVSNSPKSLFRLHRMPAIIKELNNKNSIAVFAEDITDHSWWIVTSDNLIIHYNPAIAKYETIDPRSVPPNSNGFRPSGIFTITFFEGRPAFTSHEGVWIKQPNALLWQPFDQITGIKVPFGVQKMVADGKNGYYLSDEKQLAYYNHSTRSLTNPSIKDSSYTPQFKLFAKQYAKPHLYAAIGQSYITRLRPDSAVPIQLLNQKREINRGYINDLDVDSRGQVWVSYTALGLVRYNPATGLVKRWDESDSLSVNAIMNVAIDHKDNVWTVHRRQFAVLLSGSERFFQFVLPTGNLNHNWNNHLVSLHNGNILANSYNELVEFFPERLLQKPVPRLPEISSLYINELPRRFETGKLLQLSSGENNLRIKFGLLTQKAFFPYDLLYQLDGADAKWYSAGQSNEAGYNKLAPGTYAFRIRAVAKNGSWSTQEQVLAFVIQKPVYKRAWFIALISLTLLGVLYATYRSRLHKQQQVFGLETKAAALEREKATIQYDSLKQQLNPHFLFNSLTSLAGLIEADQQMAGSFLQRMSDMYRYILKNGEHETVVLSEELKFAQLYVDIQQTRFESALVIEMDVPEAFQNFRIAPVTLQNMIENAIKHNIVDENKPLVIRIFVDGDYLVVSNNLQKKNKVEASNKTGLAQFVSLYKFLSEKPVVIEENEQAFWVKIPLI